MTSSPKRFAAALLILGLAAVSLTPVKAEKEPLHCHLCFYTKNEELASKMEQLDFLKKNDPNCENDPKESVKMDHWIKMCVTVKATLKEGQEPVIIRTGIFGPQEIICIQHLGLLSNIWDSTYIAHEIHREFASAETCFCRDNLCNKPGQPTSGSGKPMHTIRVTFTLTFLFLIFSPIALTQL